MYITADIVIWVVCLSDEVQHFLRGSNVREVWLRCRRFPVVVRINREGVTSGIFVGKAALRALVDKIVGFQDAVDVDAWNLRVGTCSQRAGNYITRTPAMREPPLVEK